MQARVHLEQWDKTKRRFAPGDRISRHYLAPARVLAWVYKTAHPLNPYFGDIRDLNTAIEMGDIAAYRDYKGQGGFESRGEWPFYSLCQTYALLEEGLPFESKELWRECAEFYLRPEVGARCSKQLSTMKQAT